MESISDEVRRGALWRRCLSGSLNAVRSHIFEIWREKGLGASAEAPMDGKVVAISRDKKSRVSCVW